MSESRPTRIGIIADYKPDYRPHAAIAEALEHSAAELGQTVEVIWFDTPRLTTLEGLNGLLICDGIWGGPGSPFKSLDGALEGIRTAREEQIPFLGTCAGFQHTAIEYARNVLGIADANSEEYNPETKSRLFVSRLACSLAGKRLDIQLTSGSLAHLSYGKCNVTEEYYCNFGLNPALEHELLGGKLAIAGRDHTGEARIIELAGHHFFIATLFVPQTSSKLSEPHPLVTAFLAASNLRRRS